MNDTREDTILSRGARHFAFTRDPRVVAAALADYRARTGLDEAGLAAWLGLSIERLHGLALCAAPDPTSPHFAAAVAALAGYIGCDAARLQALLTAPKAAANGAVGRRAGPA